MGRFVTSLRENPEAVDRRRLAFGACVLAGLSNEVSGERGEEGT